MSKLILPPPKFIPPEWHQSNSHKYNSAEKQRISSERLIDESDRLAEEAHETAKRTQQNTNNNLDDRLVDLNKWKEELNRKLTELNNENDTLIHYQNRINRALEASNEPLAISQTCLTYRNGRSGMELIHDGPEIELIKEVEVIKGVQNLLKRDVEEATEQIRRNREEMFNLGQDIKDKNSTINIDSHCMNLNNNSNGISLYPNKVRVEPNSTSTYNWRNFSNSNIKRAECERINSTRLRGIIDASLKTSCEDMKFQCKAANVALADRITETKRAKTLLENHLNKVNKEIGDQEKNISELKKAIEDKLSPMMVAQTRLKERSDRPNVELCRDPVQYGLIDEVNELTENINRMRLLLADADRELVRLTRQQRILEEDIQDADKPRDVSDEVQTTATGTGIKTPTSTAVVPQQNTDRSSPAIKKGRTGWPSCVWADALDSMTHLEAEQQQQQQQQHSQLYAELAASTGGYTADTGRLPDASSMPNFDPYQHHQPPCVMSTHIPTIPNTNTFYNHHRDVPGTSVEEMFDPTPHYVDDGMLGNNDFHMDNTVMQGMDFQQQPQQLFHSPLGYPEDHVICDDFSGGTEIAGRLLTTLPSISTLCSNADRFNTTFPDGGGSEFPSQSVMSFGPPVLDQSGQSSPDFTELQPATNSLKYSDDKSMFDLNHINQTVN